MKWLLITLWLAVIFKEIAWYGIGLEYWRQWEWGAIIYYGLPITIIILALLNFLFGIPIWHSRIETSRKKKSIYCIDIVRLYMFITRHYRIMGSRTWLILIFTLTNHTGLMCMEAQMSQAQEAQE